MAYVDANYLIIPSFSFMQLPFGPFKTSAFQPPALTWSCGPLCPIGAAHCVQACGIGSLPTSLSKK